MAFFVEEVVSNVCFVETVLLRLTQWTTKRVQPPNHIINNRTSRQHLIYKKRHLSSCACSDEGYGLIVFMQTYKFRIHSAVRTLANKELHFARRLNKVAYFPILFQHFLSESGMTVIVE